ncbi:MAG: hypothetical protein Q9216_002045 [Gyalolechia sp. 2 TL-2023]
MHPTCTLCRRRKVRCDRASPCGNCVKAGVDCFPSSLSHAPRGRQGGRKRKPKHELLERIANLEGLVKSVQAQPEDHGANISGLHDTSSATSLEYPLNRHFALHTEADGSATDQNDHDSKHATSPLERYLGGSFWATLGQEISELRDVLTTSEDDEDEYDALSTSTPQSDTEGFHHLGQTTTFDLLLNTQGPKVDTSNLRPHQLYTLSAVYLHNVDPIFKILHAPSVRRYFQDGSANLDCSPGFQGLQAIKFAVLYAAAVSMTDDECKTRVGESRELLINRYRTGTERALGQADLFNTMHLSTLQALTIYLGAVRAHDPRRLMWTLTSVAVRTAQAMNLHLESCSRPLRPFEREMRRRLWRQICLLDYQAAQDRATNPIIAADAYTAKMPLNINDEDIDVNRNQEVEERQGFTDMTLSLICHETTDTVRQLNYTPVKDPELPRDACQERWNQRVTAAIHVQQRVNEKYLRHLNLANPIHWTTRTLSDIITASVWLVVYRPLRGSFPQLADPGILRLSVDVLERANQLHTDPAASAYRWLTKSYVQWHALAVTSAELCVHTEGEMVDRAWKILLPAFEQASQYVADSEAGMLWRPVRKLMRKAQAIRKEALNSQSVKTAVPILVTGRATGGDGVDQSREIPSIGQIASATFENQIQESGPASSVSCWTPFDWEPWAATAWTSMDQSWQSVMDHNLDQTTWNNWEGFVHDVQTQGEVPGQEMNGDLAGFPIS